MAGDRRELKRGDRVSWSFHDVRPIGRIVRIVRHDELFKGKMRRASPENPQYELVSEKTGEHTMHRGSALRRCPHR
jgi:hypothetical protein